MLQRYLIRDSYISQIEGAALVNLRIDYTCLGVAAWPPRRRRGCLPLLSLAVWHHTGQRDVREILGLRLFGKRLIDWRTRGETAPA
jgi:hypothetical protein